jgi:hypothetical protein
MQLSFKTWLYAPINEASASQLRNGSVKAFPKTTKRQHSTHPIKIVEFKLSATPRTKTMNVSALAKNEAKRSQYKVSAVFEGVIFSPTKKPGFVSVEGTNYFMKLPSLDKTDVRVSCGCDDFKWKFRHWNYVVDATLGPDRKKYEALYRPDSANPTHTPGLCKHLMKFFENMRHSNLLID